jgi:hypothetical protein
MHSASGTRCRHRAHLCSASFRLVGVAELPRAMEGDLHLCRLLSLSSWQEKPRAAALQVT